MTNYLLPVDLYCMIFQFALDGWVDLRSICKDPHPLLRHIGTAIVQARLKQTRKSFIFAPENYCLTADFDEQMICTLFDLPREMKCPSIVRFMPHISLVEDFSFSIENHSLCTENSGFQLAFNEPLHQPFTVIIDATAKSYGTLFDGFSTACEIALSSCTALLVTDKPEVNQLHYLCCSKHELAKREILVATFDGENSSLRCNGIESKGSVGVVALDGVTLANSRFFDNALTADIHRLFIVPQHLSETDITDVEERLYSTWDEEI